MADLTEAIAGAIVDALSHGNDDFDRIGGVRRIDLIEAARAAWSASPGPSLQAEVERLREALATANASLNAATTLMMAHGQWTNDAGYKTDAALWIDKAQGELRAAKEPQP